MGAFDHLRIGQIDHGYYGPHTSSIDWCETNYAITPYVAEFYNTLTNLPSVLLGLWGCCASLKGGLKRRYAAGYLGLVFIGIGSFGFHASLRWDWQLMDELPMIYFVSYMAYLLLDTSPGFDSRFGILGPLALAAFNILITISYLYLPNPTYHQLAFGGLIVVSIIRIMILIRKLDIRPGSEGSKVVWTFLMGMGTFVLGFGIWNADNYFCEGLRRGREVLGPLGFILEGHGYWHILAGYGAYLGFTCGVYLILTTKTSPGTYDYDATAWFPVCHRVESPSGAIRRRVRRPSLKGKIGWAVRVEAGGSGRGGPHCASMAPSHAGRA